MPSKGSGIAKQTIITGGASITATTMILGIMLNLHSLFTGKGIEYRLFNGTMHAGKIKAYIQFCLALSAWAIESDEAIKFNKKVGLTPRQKENLFAAILRNRLGLVGPEFTTCRYWMLNKLHSSVIAEEQAA